MKAPVITVRATLYQVSLVRWIDVPKAAVDRLKLTPAENRGASKGWHALLRFQGDVDRVTLFTSRRRRHG